MYVFPGSKKSVGISLMPIMMGQLFDNGAGLGEGLIGEYSRGRGLDMESDIVIVGESLYDIGC